MRESAKKKCCSFSCELLDTKISCFLTLFQSQIVERNLRTHRRVDWLGNFIEHKRQSAASEELSGTENAKKIQLHTIERANNICVYTQREFSFFYFSLAANSNNDAFALWLAI